MPTENIYRPFRGLDRLMIEVYLYHQSPPISHSVNGAKSSRIKP